MNRLPNAVTLAIAVTSSTLLGCYERVEIAHPLCEIGDDVDESLLFGSWKQAVQIDPIFGPVRVADGDVLAISATENRFEIQVQTLRSNGDADLVIVGRITEISGKYYFEMSEVTARDRDGTQHTCGFEEYQLVAKAVYEEDRLWIATGPLSLNKELADAVRSHNLRGETLDDVVKVTDTAEALLEFLNDRPSSPTWSVACYERMEKQPPLSRNSPQASSLHQVLTPELIAKSNTP